MLDSILRAAGYRVGRYGSPHLLRFNERALIDGRPVDDGALIEQFEAVEHARGETSLTYFEFTTLAILRLFARARLDAAVLEVGLGGRLDAVNLVDADCAVVTAIGLDHTELLGETREKIGFEKAHVYRAGRPAICSDPAPPPTLVEHAAGIGADLWLLGRDFEARTSPAGDGRQQWTYRGRARGRAALPLPGLRGAHQLRNAAGVLAALESIETRLPVHQQAVRQGLLDVRIDGRYQVLPGRPVVVLDVGHNPHAAAALARTLDAHGYFPQTRAVFGMLRDKDVGGVVAQLRDRVAHWHLAPTGGDRGQDARAAAAAGFGAKDPFTCHESIAAALDAAQAASTPDDRILVFGSFVMVAEALRLLRA
jgi:dihydrofolate synthase/folylpolyglutamate synthase